MNIFVSGGCKNGKSFFAQRQAKKMAEEKDLPLYYVATMNPTDDEDRARIKRHIEERKGWGFITLEQPVNICECLAECDLTSIANERCEPMKEARYQGVFLLDSVTALLSNEMFKSDGSFDLEAAKKVAADLERFARLTGNTVFVSDYIYSEARIFDELTEKYREGLALCDRTLAAVCQEVYEVAYGTVTSHKQA